MIDRNCAKKLAFDVSSPKPSRLSDKVTVVCDCGKQTSVTYAYLINKFMKNEKYQCRSCATKLTWQNQQMRMNLIASIRKSASSTLGRQQRSAQARRAWESSQYRNKIIENSRLKYDFNFTDDIRKKLSDSTKRLWQTKLRERYEIGHTKGHDVSASRVSRSCLEVQVEHFLTHLSIKFISEHKLGPYTFDFFLPDHNILLEINGDYWHSIPENKNRDASKSTYINNNFPHLKLYQIWEHEFASGEAICSKIRSIVGIDDLAIDFNFSDAIIRTIDWELASKFYDCWHYLHSLSKSSITFGVFINDDLIGCCSFSNPSRQEIADKQNIKYGSIMELNRLCIKPRCHKKNLASFMIGKAIKMLRKLKPNITKLVTFADTSFNHDGCIYKATNWLNDGVTKPNYWYINKEGWVMHKKKLHNKATKMRMKESEYADIYGYKKMWGSHKIRFVYEMRGK